MSSTVATVGAAVNLLVTVAEATQVISSLIQEAASSGRTTLTDAEWSSITGAADKAHQALEAALGTPSSTATADPAAAPAA